MQPNTIQLTTTFNNKAFIPSPTTTTTTYSTSFPSHHFILPFEEVYLLSSSSVSSCDVEAIESLFCLRESTCKEENVPIYQPQVSSVVSQVSSNAKDVISSKRKGGWNVLTTTSPKKNENPNSGKRKRVSFE